MELVPGIATEFGLRVTAGAWIDKNQDRNEREIRSVIEQTKRHSNINGVIVGNETIFRGEQKVSDLIPMIQRVKRSTNVPVTTGEIWHVWIEHPELVSAVDYIAAHILPYWEGFSETQAVDQAVLIYDKLRKAYPGKRIVIAEFGWPSAGYNYKNANPGRIDQAVVLRDFVTRAEAYGIDYNIVEAIDQPWKIFEGGVGPYWGVFRRRASSEVRMDRTDHGSRSLATCCDRDPRQCAAVAASGGNERRYALASRDAGRFCKFRRRMVCRRVRLLERALFCPGGCLRSWTWHDTARALDRDRARTH